MIVPLFIIVVLVDVVVVRIACSSSLTVTPELMVTCEPFFLIVKPLLQVAETVTLVPFTVVQSAAYARARAIRRQQEQQHVSNNSHQQEKK